MAFGASHVACASEMRSKIDCGIFRGVEVFAMFALVFAGFGFDFDAENYTNDKDDETDDEQDGT